MMTTTPLRGSVAERTRVARRPSMPAERPAAVLDRCLAQSRSLLHKVDRLSAEVMAGSPRDLQVHVCTNLTRDTSAYLPIGRVATDPLRAGTPEATDTPTGKQLTDSAPWQLAAGTTIPKSQQVQVCMNQTRDASDYLPIGSVATGPLTADPTSHMVEATP